MNRALIRNYNVLVLKMKFNRVLYKEDTVKIFRRVSLSVPNVKASCTNHNYKEGEGGTGMGL